MEKLTEKKRKDFNELVKLCTSEKALGFQSLSLFIGAMLSLLISIFTKQSYFIVLLPITIGLFLWGMSAIISKKVTVTFGESVWWMVYFGKKAVTTGTHIVLMSFLLLAFSIFLSSK